MLKQACIYYHTQSSLVVGQIAQINSQKTQNNIIMLHLNIREEHPLARPIHHQWDLGEQGTKGRSANNHMYSSQVGASII